MRFTTATPIDSDSVSVVVDDHHGPRIQIRCGPSKITLSRPEAVRLATQLVDRIAEMRAGQPAATTGTDQR